MKLQRWLPQTLTGQLLSLLLIGLVASHAIGVLLLSSQRELGELHPLARRKTLETYATLYRAVNNLDAATARRTLEAAGTGPTQFTLVATPASFHADEQDDTVVEDLTPQLTPAPLAMRVCTGDTCAPTAVAQTGRMPLRPVLIQAQRPDGQWMQATTWIEVRTRWWWLSSFWLQASVIPIFIAVALAVRGLMRPAKALVAAAGRVSRGETVEPLPLTGPLEMREITHAFNQMQLRIGKFVDDRTRMLAAVSHDFRTPITSLRLRTEMIEDEALREPMLRTLREMRSMVDATLQFARDDAEHEPTIDTDLRDLADEVIAGQRAQGRDVAWEVEPSPCWPYRGRPIGIKRALTNLVNNAVRYGEHARLRLVLLPDGTHVALEVQDNGPGIRPGAREAVFAPFKRLTAEGDTRGAGLGLAIARSCARAHGGDVELHDGQHGRGLLARLVLPV